jgi:hypothetical protein
MRRIRIIVFLETLLIAFAISPAEAVPVQGPDGYFYELVPTPGTWPTARAAALASSHQGAPGHLAIVTSAAVDSFLAGLAPIGWLGGSDQASEGTWTWSDGPQANQVFWIGGPGGSAPGGVYTNWSLAQPDNGGVQNFLLRGPGGWDDFGGVQPYYVRYTVPEPGTFLLFGAALAGAGWAIWHQRRRRHALGRMGR